MLIDHTGFCISQMDTEKCFDCPTLKECLVLYGKDRVTKVLEQINKAGGNIRKKHRRSQWTDLIK